MKVQCDFCRLEAASLFCCADEAALCDSCDRKIHHANKVASKHRRFSLVHPSSAQAASHKPTPPLCDICQEKRGFIFCKEDRAILCRDCDVPIHTASDLTREHTRFLLTGVQLSSAPIADAPMIVEEEEEVENGSLDNVYTTISAVTKTGTDANSNNAGYFINAFPAWHAEEILFDTTTSTAAMIAPIHHYQQGQVNHQGLHEGFPVWASQGKFF